MLIQPLDYALLVWFALAGLSAVYVAYDQWRNNPEPNVMRAGFVLVTLYMGPLGFLLYVLADKEPKPGTHEEFVRPLWKQGVGSTIHCVAGDATGIILAAVITASLARGYIARTTAGHGGFRRPERGLSFCTGPQSA